MFKSSSCVHLLHSAVATNASQRLEIMNGIASPLGLLLSALAACAVRLSPFETDCMNHGFSVAAVLGLTNLHF